MLLNSSTTDIPITTTNLYIGVDNGQSTNELILNSNFENLEELVFVKNSATYIRNITIDGLPELNAIRFGEYSCRLGSSSRNDGHLVIANSPKLLEISVNSYSMQDYSTVIISNLTILRSLYIDSYALQNIKTIELYSNSNKVLISYRSAFSC